MLSGKNLGLLSSLIGISIGAYYSLSPVIFNLSNSFLTSHDAGLQLAVIATIVGLSFATIGAISNKQRKNT